MIAKEIIKDLLVLTKRIARVKNKDKNKVRKKGKKLPGIRIFLTVSGSTKKIKKAKLIQKKTIRTKV